MPVYRQKSYTSPLTGITKTWMKPYGKQHMIRAGYQRAEVNKRAAQQKLRDAEVVRNRAARVEADARRADVVAFANRPIAQRGFRRGAVRWPANRVDLARKRGFQKPFKAWF